MNLRLGPAMANKARALLVRTTRRYDTRILPLLTWIFRRLSVTLRVGLRVEYIISTIDGTVVCRAQGGALLFFGFQRLARRSIFR